MTFIELHTSGSKNKVLYNINHIVKFYEPEEKSGCLIFTDDGYKKKVKESYEEVRELVNNPSNHIKIDKTKRLTFDDLKNMIGELVWDDVEKQWCVVRYCTISEVCLSKEHGECFWIDSQGLKLNPIYKIRLK